MLLYNIVATGFAVSVMSDCCVSDNVQCYSISAGLHYFCTTFFSLDCCFVFDLLEPGIDRILTRSECTDAGM